MTQPRGIRNNNPLNIRKGSKWKGEKDTQTDSQFEQFDSMEYGLRAALILIRNYIDGHNSAHRKFDSIESLISRWAPPSENATRNYIDVVAGRVGIHPRQRLNFSDREMMIRLVQAMAHVECGQEIERTLIESAYSMI